METYERSHWEDKDEQITVAKKKSELKKTDIFDLKKIETEFY